MSNSVCPKRVTYLPRMLRTEGQQILIDERADQSAGDGVDGLTKDIYGNIGLALMRSEDVDGMDRNRYYGVWQPPLAIKSTEAFELTWWFR